MREGSRVILEGCRLVPLSVKGDERGSLIAIEEATGLPFAMSRVYYIFGTKPGVTRGLHAHQDLVQWAISVSGACTMVLDNGHERGQARLDSPDKALEIGPMVWHEMCDFTPDSVLLVIASKPYDPADYISDYQHFLGLVGRG